jgi:CRP-like cAMP-binding protein
VSQQDLANLVGTSRESINKQLRRWEEQGLIRIRRRELTVLRPAALEALVAAAKD